MFNVYFLMDVFTDDDLSCSTGYHNALPLEVHGAGYAQMQMVSNAKALRLVSNSFFILYFVFFIQIFFFQIFILFFIQIFFLFKFFFKFNFFLFIQIFFFSNFFFLLKFFFFLCNMIELDCTESSARVCKAVEYRH